ncbi:MULTISPECIES: hypothetical protein [unclassified Sulfitobacter]|mgnify:CR=1 FL=1|uniref:hypothetical protein n=1 Tax=unclassified Sulfitobacter TaxID=196795 RepID=UPI001EF11129|nr:MULTISPECIES: hypothetical protein [unclassified Sulfitobacter]MCF7727936.1 hypothetical protein [Sulfitobacter sp. M22]
MKRLKSELISENSVVSNMDDARRLFRKAAEASGDVKVRREIRAIVGGSGAKGVDAGYWPVLRAVEREPTKSLEDIFGGDLPYTNERYIDALIDYGSAFIRAWSEIRRRLRTEHPDLYASILETVKRIGVESLRDIEKKRTYSKKVSARKDDWLELLKINIEILVVMDDPFLNMIAMAQYRNTSDFDQFVAAVDLPVNGAAGFAKELLTEKGPQSQPKTQWSIWKAGKHEASISSRLKFSLLDFLGPSLEEETCLTWLLSSRRIQLSNRDRLKRFQINEDAKSFVSGAPIPPI